MTREPRPSTAASSGLPAPSTAHASLPASFFDTKLARALLPISWLYGAAASLRRDWVSRRARRLDRPVISVGNITCGGTGKTPVVEMIAKDLVARGVRPAILSRGYGGPAARPGGGDAPGNDELLVLSQNVPGVAHVQGKDRVARGEEAIRAGAQALILDDGFQHVRLARDLDIVLIDALAPFGHGRVLPAGLLREPLAALARAQLFGITRSDQIDPVTLSTLAAYLRNRFRGVPQVQLAMRPAEWVRLSGERDGPDALRGRRALAFCGIGNPEAFRRQVIALGVELVGFVPFRDHHGYTGSDMKTLHARASALRADEVILTQKDAVKIAGASDAAGWRYLRIEARITRGEAEYERSLTGIIEASRRHAG
jgi:tetraacyldisaccharide 4'-kinase